MKPTRGTAPRARVVDVVWIAWIVAVVVAALILGIVGFQVVGQGARLTGSLRALRRDVAPRVADLAAQFPSDTSSGRHSAERLYSGR